MALLGCALVKAHRQRLVLRHAIAVVVADAKTVVRFCEALVGRLPEQPCGLGLVLRHAISLQVEHA
jgi:sRNA-binding regulator protein Hfq